MFVEGYKGHQAGFHLQGGQVKLLASLRIELLSLEVVLIKYWPEYLRARAVRTEKARNYPRQSREQLFKVFSMGSAAAATGHIFCFDLYAVSNRA
ncbi:hypothetical protein EVAR_99773_1 [Eumeta japonica]|uniref:Uncharacterized protein n=1 Tax=Eumeta variegata TaxID=151549 RepID=A0A4C1ZIL9_EUMVA|nr:hypothetical protein EVAR_99773_1 [Eumeta japonica]